MKKEISKAVQGTFATD